MSALPSKPAADAVATREQVVAILELLETRMLWSTARPIISATGMPRTTSPHRLVPESEFMLRMSSSAESLAKLVADGKLFFVVRDGRKLYPSFFMGQSSDDRIHLEEVTGLLAGVDDLAKWLFFTTPKGSLAAQTPLAALKERRLAAVRRTAEGFAQR